jgi:tryptophanyl-tRNA synthetase
MLKQKKTLLSGVKPTGISHIGNYFGAMKQFVNLQDEYEESLFFIADYHALTTIHNADELSRDIFEVALDYLALGLDPKKSIMFKQSDVPAHTELAWIFNCITTMPYLMRAHAFKDAQAKNKEIGVGTFDYPMLMVADILLYGADAVPIGKDQKQHVEIARDTAEKFNRLFGETFKLPEPIIQKEVATVPGIDGQKMSKSYNNTIPLFADDAEIDKLVMSIVTDSKDVSEPKDPDTDNVFALHKFFSVERLEELEKKYREGGIGYKESKELLAENIKRFTKPLREKRKEMLKDRSFVLTVLDEGAIKAREIAEKKMREIKEKIGVGSKKYER